MDKDLKNLTIPQLQEITTSAGVPSYTAGYIFSFIHEKDIADIDSITPLSGQLRNALKKSGYYISRLKIMQRLCDTDGTVKYLFELGDGLKIESVLLTDGQRKTACISTQVGCRMGCEFCATAKIKFKRNLTAAEIVDQVYVIGTEHGRVGNVVYMGMGEPLDNFEQVIRSVEILNDPRGKNIGQRHITISTCGITQGIEALADENMQVRLAVSLHAPTDHVRGKIMPAANKHPLKKLFASLEYYQNKTKRRVTFEYCMIKDLNDSQQQAVQLTKLLKPLNVNVNLIEFNPYPGSSFEPSNPEKIKEFAQILREANIETVIRYKRGQKIKAACGQLGASFLE